MSEKKKLVILIVVCIVCAIIGFGAGALSHLVSNQLDLRAAIVQAAPTLLIVCSALLTVMVLGTLGCCLSKTRALSRRIRALSADDEDEIEAIERAMNVPMITTSVLMIAAFALFPICAALILPDTVTRTLAACAGLLDLSMFILGMAGVFALQKRCIDLEKQLNPEKRGSLLDITFQKQWMDSCDEAELLTIYRAGYQAYRAGSAACLLLWLAAVISMFMFSTGVAPIVFVCAIWLVLVLAYSKAACQ